MKTNSLSFGRWWWTLGFLGTFLLTASPEDQPVITSIRSQGTNVVVSVQVPAGIRRVTLESRSRLGAGNWEPRAVTRLDVSGGQVTIRIAKIARLEVLRVRADDREPLPAKFYTGTNSFDGQPVSSGGLAGALDGAGDARGTAPTPEAPSRDVVESDIWQIRGDTLYFFNQYRGLQIIDISNPDQVAVKGTLPLPATGDQMYLLGSDHVVLLARDGCGWSQEGPES